MGLHLRKDRSSGDYYLIDDDNSLVAGDPSRASLSLADVERLLSNEKQAQEREKRNTREFKVRRGRGRF